MARPYHRPMSSTWWLKRWPYAKFMLRELSSVFVAIYLVGLLRLVSTVYVMPAQAGKAAYEAFVAVLGSPSWLLFHVVALAAALFHTITWFNLTPQAMVLYRGEERVPAKIIAGSNYVAWAVVSLAVMLMFALAR